MNAIQNHAAPKIRLVISILKTLTLGDSRRRWAPLIPWMAGLFLALALPPARGAQSPPPIRPDDPSNTPPVVAEGAADSFDLNANNYVNCMAHQRDGKLVVGGSFTMIKGVARNRIARFNADGSLDTTFNPSADGVVTSLLVLADGKILVGGDFKSIAPTTRNRLARLNPDGLLDSTFNPNLDGQVNSMAIQPDGKIVIAGEFTVVGVSTRNRLARLNADGTLDMSFDPNANGSVYGAAVQPDGKIVAGGAFTTMKGATRNRLARLNADGTLDGAFNPNASAGVNVVLVQTDGKILLGGGFTTVGGTTRNRLARLNATGSLDTAFNPNANNTVVSMALQADGKILVGGSFTSAGGVTRNRLLRLNANGSLDTAFNPNANERVVSIAIQADGNVLLGGYFTTVGGATRTRVARIQNGTQTRSLEWVDPTRVRWMRSGAVPEIDQVSFEFSLDGSLWTALGAGIRVAGGWEKTGLGLASPGTLRARGRVISGQYGGSAGWIEQNAPSYAGIDMAFNPNVNSSIRTTAVQPDGKILVGGVFTSVGGVARTNFARLNADGTIDSAFIPAVNGAVGSVALQTDGKILVGGAFTSVGGVTRSNLARLNANGTLDAAFNTPVASLELTTIALQPDGRILFADSFPTRELRRLHENSTRDRSLLPINAGVEAIKIPGENEQPPGPNDVVPIDGGGSPTIIVPIDGAPRLLIEGGITAVALQADGKILVGGKFPDSGISDSGARLARLKSDGTLDGETFRMVFGSDEGFKSFQSTVLVQADGKILMGEDFASLSKWGRDYLTRLDANGALDEEFAPTVNARVLTVALQADGKILLGGDFTLVGGVVRNHLARINADGTLDPTFNPDVNGAVTSLALAADGTILLAGDFTSVNGVPRNRMARLQNGLAVQTIERVDSARVRWLRGGAAPEVEQMTFEHSGDNGNTWIRLGSGARIQGGWQLAAQDIPYGGLIRARGRISSGRYNGSSGLVEQIASASINIGPRIAVEQPAGRLLADGASIVDFGALDFGADTSFVFTIKNAGNLDLTDLRLVLDGPMASDYSVTTAPAGRVAIGGVNTFTVRFRPRDGGVRLAALHLFSNDPGKSPFDITLTGVGGIASLDASFDPNVNDTIRTTVVQPDGKILFGGTFTSVGGSTRTNLARLNTDGTLDPVFNPAVNGAVNSLALQPDGKTLLGGAFTASEGNYLARLNANGTRNQSFKGKADREVTTLALQPDGRILFTAPPNLVRLEPDGQIPFFGPPRGAKLAEGVLNGSFTAVVLQPDGKILVGGNFPDALFRSHRLDRLESDGKRDLSFNRSFGIPVEFITSSANSTVLLQADGRILMADDFVYVYPGDPTYPDFLLRYNANGTRETAFAPAINKRVLSAALQADGKILIGGEFTTVGGAIRNRLIRLNANGTRDSTFSVDVNGTVTSLALQVDGRILVGGEFTAVNGVPRNRLARLHNGFAAQTLTRVDSTQMRWLRGGTAPEVEQVTFDYSGDYGFSWTSMGSGSRIAGGWQGTSTNVPSAGLLRARGRTSSGRLSGSSGMVEQIATIDSRFDPRSEAQSKLTGLAAGGPQATVGAIDKGASAGQIRMFSAGPNEMSGEGILRETNETATAMSIAANGNYITISWTGGGILESADQVSGPYQSTGNSYGIFTTSASGNARFYRVKKY